MTSSAIVQSTPESVIAIGGSPYALDLTANGKAAIVSLIFLVEDDNPNLFWIDLEAGSVAGWLRCCFCRFDCPGEWGSL